MSRQVLILNVTRMGDLIQMGTLIARLRHEWPDVEIDLVVDRQFESVARLMSGIRRIHAYDFNRLVNDCRAMSRDVVEVYREVKQWAAPLVEARYDRLINLTFTRRTGLLAGYLQVPDVRGVVSAPDGSTSIRNPWLAYFTDLHQYRRFNRFNLVDLYALGGSGPGPHAPLSLRVDDAASAWAETNLEYSNSAPMCVAVQVGASEAIKAWRPAYFGRSMASLSRRVSVQFVLIGSASERPAAQAALAAYRQVGGTAPVRDFVGRTSLSQLIAVLARARLLLTNDTGPMHMAVAVGTRVIDLSVGHVDFHETGPYGRGHWVVQPDLECAPCGFDRVCFHHACKDRIEVDGLAQLCAHVLGQADLPNPVTGAKLYESDVDADGLVCYRQRAGMQDARDEWYGQWWRHFWFAEFTGCRLGDGIADGAVPDREQHVQLFAQLEPIMSGLREQVGALERAARRRPLQGRELQTLHRSLSDIQRRIADLTDGSPIYGPLIVALRRELACNEEMSVPAMAQARTRALCRWTERVCRVHAVVSGGNGESGCVTAGPNLIVNHA